MDIIVSALNNRFILALDIFYMAQEKPWIEEGVRGVAPKHIYSLVTDPIFSQCQCYHLLRELEV